jgi:hypothetical protein
MYFFYILLGVFCIVVFVIIGNVFAHFLLKDASIGISSRIFLGSFITVLCYVCVSKLFLTVFAPALIVLIVFFLIINRDPNKKEPFSIISKKDALILGEAILVGLVIFFVLFGYKMFTLEQDASFWNILDLIHLYPDELAYYQMTSNDAISGVGESLFVSTEHIGMPPSFSYYHYYDLYLTKFIAWTSTMNYSLIYTLTLNFVFFTLIYLSVRKLVVEKTLFILLAFALSVFAIICHEKFQLKYLIFLSIILMLLVEIQEKKWRNLMLLSAISPFVNILFLPVVFLFGLFAVLELKNRRIFLFYLFSIVIIPLFYLIMNLVFKNPVISNTSLLDHIKQTPNDIPGIVFEYLLYFKYTFLLLVLLLIIEKTLRKTSLFFASLLIILILASALLSLYDLDYFQLFYYSKFLIIIPILLVVSCAEKSHLIKKAVYLLLVFFILKNLVINFNQRGSILHYSYSREFVAAMKSISDPGIYVESPKSKRIYSHLCFPITNPSCLVITNSVDHFISYDSRTFFDKNLETVNKYYSLKKKARWAKYIYYDHLGFSSFTDLLAHAKKNKDRIGVVFSGEPDSVIFPTLDSCCRLKFYNKSTYEHLFIITGSANQ